MKSLLDSSYGTTETLRENRYKKSPLKAAAAMKKEPRGIMEFVAGSENKIMVCRWMDNSVVTIASTVHVSKASSKVKRYSQKEKKTIEINCPKVVQECNKHMGEQIDKIKI